MREVRGWLPAVLVLFASSNPHKVSEVRAVLELLGHEVIGLDSLPHPASEPAEDGVTLVQNARLKAIAYARMTGYPCLADDSGLEVDALGGAPGVHSARYAGVEGSRAERDRANNQRLLQELTRVPRAERTARFVCVLVLAEPDGTIVAETQGTCEGVILDAPRGQHGFGYDPLLWLPDLDKTFAELSAAAKNARSHRGAAARAMAEVLAQRRRP